MLVSHEISVAVCPVMYLQDNDAWSMEEWRVLTHRRCSVFRGCLISPPPFVQDQHWKLLVITVAILNVFVARAAHNRNQRPLQ